MKVWELLSRKSSRSIVPKLLVVGLVVVLLDSKILSRKQDMPEASDHEETSTSSIRPETFPSIHANQNVTPEVKPTIVVQFSGEMGNYLSHLSVGFGLHWWLEEEFMLSADIVLRKFLLPGDRERPKWKRAQNSIKACFPKLSMLDFEQGNSYEFDRRMGQQNAWKKAEVDEMQGLVNSWKEPDIHQGLERFKTLLEHPRRPMIESSATISVPFIYSQSLDPFVFIDRYRDRLRNLFALNASSPRCCRLRAHANETVFHFRNFYSDIGGSRADAMGFPEASPHQAAFELLKSAETVAMTTRLGNKVAEQYVDALVSAGVPTRLIRGQNGVQDFCFLVSTRTEMVGNARSTFALWAGLLGNASRVRLYHVNSTGLRNRHSAGFWKRFTHDFRDKDLAKRIRFELYDE